MIVHFLLQGTRFTGGRAILLDHAAALRDRGHSVIVFTPKALDWAPAGLPMQILPGRLSDLPPADATLFERPSMAAQLVRAGVRRPIQFVQGFEGSDAEIRRDAVGAWHPIVRWKMARRVRQIDRAYRLPTTKFVVHPHLAELIAARYGQSAALVPNGLPTGVFTPTADRFFTTQTLLIVGPTDTPSKRIIDALQAAALAKRQLPGLRVIRVAQHPQRSAEKMLGVTNEYHTMVAAGAMADLYRRADAVLLPYNAAEGFGLPAIEAMACGTPTILTDIPAFKTFDLRRDYAVFVEAGKVEAMADAIVRLFGDESERRRLSARGPEVASRYTRQRSHDAMESALQNLLDQGR